MVVTYAETFGMGSVIDRFKLFAKGMSGGARTRAAMAGAYKARELIEEDMARPKTGLQWPDRPPDRKMPVRSSSPSETPASQGGQLLHKLTVKQAGPGVAHLESGDKHAWWMEFGFTTKDGGFHIRPWMRPIVDRNRSDIEAEMKRAMMTKEVTGWRLG